MISLRFIVLPALAVTGFVLTAYTVNKQNQPVPPPPIPIAPNASPFVGRVAGIGAVEPSSEIIKVGAPLGALIESMRAVEGGVVRAGETLFTLDRRDATARLASAEADLRVALANLANLESRPRVEDVARAAARVEARRAAVDDAKGRLRRLEEVGVDAAVSANERPTLEFQVASWTAQVAEAEADLAQVKRGAYPEELEQARAQVAVATAKRDEARTSLERLTIASPIDGTILSVAIRQGEFAPAGPQAPTLVAIGALDPLHLRVEIDELDAWRFDGKAPAVAMLRGSEKREFPLRFVRVVPQIVPKRTLSGDMGERTDTRVMQVIYAIEPSKDGRPADLLTGQVLDVFIERRGG
ncbi:MAG: biotin/lipoyl-binding protein [Phycisphaerae bacterium]|jgi:HlyD family secretion protein|nr:biotin/lipoyl-binding protein [Phycisphaerae bacterium]